MFVHDFFRILPLLNDIRAQFLHTLGAQVSNLCPVRIAVQTKVVENYVDFKIIVQNFAFVLANVLGRKLHFACTDVVAILNERGVKHYATNHCL